MRAARSLDVAVRFLPANLRAEATTALLACRILNTYSNHRVVGYLNGDTDALPQPAVGPVLTERLRDVRVLLSELPFEGQERVGRLLVDVGRAHGVGALGPAVLYVCELVTEGVCAEADLGELAGCVGAAVELADDWEVGELVLHGGDRTQAVLQRMLVSALGSFALLARLGPCIRSRGARAAIAYIAITTTESLCAAFGAPAPYPRPARRAAAVVAAVSTGRWTAMLKRLRCSVDAAIHHLLDASPDHRVAAVAGAADLPATGDPCSMPPAVGPLMVGTAFALTEVLPAGPLTGELPQSHVRRMMIADHLTFCALERLHPRDADAMSTLATELQLIALAAHCPRGV
ncbi:hypothetical protein H7J88_25820 [Mycolicibacterium flavescens]|uniref:Uncharacterized protein n=1 Tax=Mycolicibacterium flavescens TaxID=1776 RepID=A0A1E3RC96_MYCFV|nr:hypothetical protein [Mycolicibacterium flavescens]MCV7283058.1 hypothetical protein [Mycolicibacterium flavescens]ODQ87513.1 hypothetical protein BHQ18_23165 [Mycolicibacterium flavescens]